MERIQCNMSKNEFTQKYVNKREAVMMIGCQDKWKAKHWTIENLFHRYNYVRFNQSYQQNSKTGHNTQLTIQTL